MQFSYAVFYIIFITMATTELAVAFEDIEWLKPVNNLAKETPNIVQWKLYTFFVIHIASGVGADLTKYNSIFSRMINDRENNLESWK